MQLFSADATMFFKKCFFCPQKVEKITLKICSKKSNPLFFLTALSCPNCSNRRIHVQNVTYRLTIYRTGSLPDH